MPRARQGPGHSVNDLQTNRLSHGREREEGGQSRSGRRKPWCWSYTGGLKTGRIRGRRNDGVANGEEGSARADGGKNTDAPTRSCRQFSRPHLSKSTQLRKASSLLRNESRASVLFGGPFPAPNFGSRVFSSALVLTSSSSGLWGSLRSPRTRPPPDGSSFTHGMTFQEVRTATRMPIVFPLTQRGTRRSNLIFVIVFRRHVHNSSVTARRDRTQSY